MTTSAQLTQLQAAQYVAGGQSFKQGDNRAFSQK
jgi:hypothetical protein